MQFCLRLDFQKYAKAMRQQIRVEVFGENHNRILVAI